LRIVTIQKTKGLHRWRNNSLYQVKFCDIVKEQYAPQIQYTNVYFDRNVFATNVPFFAIYMYTTYSKG